MSSGPGVWTGAGIFVELSAHAGIAHAIAWPELADLRADAFDDAGRLVSKAQGKGRLVVGIKAATSHVDVGEIDANRGMPDPDLIWRELGERYVNRLQFFDAAVPPDADCLGHVDSSQA